MASTPLMLSGTLGQGAQRRVLVRWDDGRLGVLVGGAAQTWLPSYAAIATGRSCAQYQADPARLYRALLEAALPYLAGPVPCVGLTPRSPRLITETRRRRGYGGLQGWGFPPG